MKSFQPFFTLLKLILSCSLIFQSYAFSKVPADVLDAKMKAYQVLKKRVKSSDGDDRYWGGDKPSSYSNLKYDLPLMASPRIVDVNEFDIMGVLEVWSEEFDINFDKEFYRRADFQQIFRDSKQNSSQARDIILATFSLEYISYLMNNDVRFNQEDYNNPIPEFRRYNKYVIYIVTYIYNLWKTNNHYHSFLNQFYKSLPGEVFDNTSKTNNTLKAFDDPTEHSCSSKNCVKDWPSTKGEHMSVEPLVKKRDSLDEDDGWMNPMDWFGMHDQEEINILNYEILEQDIIHNIVEGIHTIHEKKNELMRHLIRTGNLEAYEWIVNGIIAMTSVVAIVFIVKGGVAYTLTLQGVPVLGGGAAVATANAEDGEILVVTEDGETYTITEGGEIITEGGGTQVAMNFPVIGATGLLVGCISVLIAIDGCQKNKKMGKQINNIQEQINNIQENQQGNQELIQEVGKDVKHIRDNSGR